MMRNLHEFYHDVVINIDSSVERRYLYHGEVILIVERTQEWRSNLLATA